VTSHLPLFWDRRDGLLYLGFSGGRGDGSVAVLKIVNQFAVKSSLLETPD
jgi:hypothetical protein